MKQPFVYDKAKYHLEFIEKQGLPVEHASNHTVVFLRWLIENDLLAEWLLETTADKNLMKRYRAGKATIHQIYGWWDYCLIDDMLSKEGNKFARHYFDFEKGQYIEDYMDTLQGSLPSELHVKYNERNYRRIKKVINQRYEEWKLAEAKRRPKKKPARKQRPTN